ncbi:calcium-binding protein, partial [Primorskyibacter sp. 2E233]|uniref:calcium-binding protein n=1 Tax=Primorskyibacter sp. 2E233 TaxID=3413431 RepID=UPI003BF10391
IGGAGNDSMYGNAGNDTVSYADATSGVGARLDEGGGGWNGAVGDYIYSAENLIGSAFDDALVGNAGSNMLDGGEGDDILWAEDGNDLLIGGQGADTMHGQGGNDTVSYADATSGVGARLDEGGGGWRGAVGDYIYSAENLIGSAFDDSLVGNSGANILDGSTGDDILWGLEGSDRFVFNGGFDIVGDFSYAEMDQIALDVSELGISGMSAQQVVSTYADTSTGQIVLDFGNGNALTLSGVSDMTDLENSLLLI